MFRFLDWFQSCPRSEKAARRCLLKKPGKDSLAMIRVQTLLNGKIKSVGLAL